MTTSEGFKKDDQVKWTYLHHLNAKSSLYRTKQGIYLRAVKSKDGVARSAVLFKGNKTESIVPTTKLKIV